MITPPVKYQIKHEIKQKTSDNNKTQQSFVIQKSSNQITLNTEKSLRIRLEQKLYSKVPVPFHGNEF